MDINYTSTDGEAFIINSLLTNRAMLAVLLQAQAELLAAIPGRGTSEGHELNELLDQVEREREKLSTELRGKGPQDGYQQYVLKKQE